MIYNSLFSTYLKHDQEKPNVKIFLDSWSFAQNGDSMVWYNV